MVTLEVTFAAFQVFHLFLPVSCSNDDFFPSSKLRIHAFLSYGLPGMLDICIVDCRIGIEVEVVYFVPKHTNYLGYHSLSFCLNFFYFFYFFIFQIILFILWVNLILSNLNC